MSLDIVAPSRPLSTDFSTYSVESNSSSVESSLATISDEAEAEGPVTPQQPQTRSHGILAMRSRTFSSASSSPGTSTTSVNVKFAPLPELAPRKRKSSTPLGVAARSQMMRRRRQHMAATAEHQAQNGMWTQEEIESHRQRQHNASHPGYSPATDEDDPFLALGKMMKGAWRRMAHKKDGVPVETPTVVAGDVRVALAPISPPNEGEAEEGGVWEEEVGDTFRRPGGQVEEAPDWREKV